MSPRKLRIVSSHQAGRDEAAKEVVLKAINVSAQPVTANLKILGASHVAADEKSSCLGRPAFGQQQSRSTRRVFPEASAGTMPRRNSNTNSAALAHRAAFQGAVDFRSMTGRHVLSENSKMAKKMELFSSRRPQAMRLARSTRDEIGMVRYGRSPIGCAAVWLSARND